MKKNLMKNKIKSQIKFKKSGKMILGADFGIFRTHGEIFYIDLNDDDYFSVYVDLEDFLWSVEHCLSD